jgi:rhodanese-related sulfurtransferase
MDGNKLPAISALELYRSLGRAASPLVLDLRPDASDHALPGSARRSASESVRWAASLPNARAIVVYAEDEQASREAAAALGGSGVAASYLSGGLKAWIAAKLPLRRTRGPEQQPSRWVTREHPKIDRIACPWLVSRLIDPLAEFVYVPPNTVAQYAKDNGAIPYDIDDVEFGHVGDRCSFDAIVKAYDIHDAALDRLATIVRGADTSRPDLTPQCEGLLAISYGLSSNFPDDHEMLRHGLVMYDALYTWCRGRGSH